MMLCPKLLVAVALLTPTIFAQTFTDCNPMNETCPPDAAFGTNHNFVFNTSRTVTDSFNATAGALTYGTNGAEFTVAKRGDSPTIQSNFHIFWGQVSVILKAAPGQGIVSSIVLQSDDLDEIDWEWIGGNGTHVQTNYFGKGNTTSYDRAVWHEVSSDVRENFHNYTVYWTQEKLDFYIDGAKVRTLPYAAANGGKNYPQTPMDVRLGIWAGGDPSLNKYTIEWAGGLTDFSKAPYTMNVKEAYVQDYSKGAQYQWTDRTGSFQSIKSIAGNSTAQKTIEKTANEKPSLSIAQKFQNLPQGTKIAIYASGGAAGAILLSALLFFCCKQRRAGRRERDAYNAKVEKERQDAYNDQMELREKGLGGWDKKEYASQGDDALGGWGGTHVLSGYSHDNDSPGAPKMPPNVMVSEIPSRSANASPASFSRTMSPAPSLAQPVPQSARQWGGGNPGGMIQNAGNAYSGAYGGNQNYSGGQNIPRSPSFQDGSHVVQPQQQRGYPGGYSHGGYQRF